MHLLSQYALSCGLKIDKPYIWEEFFPLPFENGYIIFHPVSKPAKTYDYWEDALNLIYRNLPKDIKILRIGDKNENPYEYCINIHGQTNLNNAAYLIKRAKGYLGTDTFSAHIASAYNLPLLALYSSSPSYNSGLYFGDKSRQVVIDSPKPGKPSYSFTENPKTINNIPPEEIAGKFLNLMGYPYNNEFKSIHFGAEYLKRKQIMFVPNAPISAPPNVTPEIRMDFYFDENILAQELSRRPCYIVTNKPINLDLLRKFKKHVAVIVYVLEEDNNSQFPKDTRKLGINTFLASFMSREKIQELKIKYYEIGAIKTVDRTDKAKVEELKALPNLYYRSQKLISAGGKLYSSRAALIAGKEKTSADFEPVIDTEMFWDNLNDFYFVQKVDKTA